MQRESPGNLAITRAMTMPELVRARYLELQFAVVLTDLHDNRSTIGYLCKLHRIQQPLSGSTKVEAAKLRAGHAAQMLVELGLFGPSPFHICHIHPFGCCASPVRSRCSISPLD